MTTITPHPRDCDGSSSRRGASFGRRQSRRSRRRRGAYTVEFAISATVFFMVIFACFELSRFVYVRHAVDQTCYEAARRGVVAGATPADVQARATELLNAYGVAFTEINVTPAVFDETTAEINVSVRCNFADNSWLVPRFVTASDFTSAITLDHENQAFLIPEAAAAAGALNDNEEPIDE